LDRVGEQSSHLTLARNVYWQEFYAGTLDGLRIELHQRRNLKRHSHRHRQAELPRWTAPAAKTLGHDANDPAFLLVRCRSYMKGGMGL
jgi:hypothetical protein